MENSNKNKEAKRPVKKIKFSQREINRAIRELSKEVNKKVTTRLFKELIAGK